MSSAILVPMALAYLMFVVGLDTRLADFAVLARRPRVVLAGLVGQMIGLPILAFLIATGLRLPPDLAIGLAIVAAAPGGVTANYATALARGDVALSVVLTALTSLAAVVSVPVVVGLASGLFGAALGAVSLPAGKTILVLIVTVVAPLALGLIAARVWPGGVTRHRATLGRVALAVFAAILIGAVAARWRLIMEELPVIGLAVGLLVGLAMALGAALGRLAEGSRVARTLAIECGLQNVALALVVVELIGRPELDRVATVYAFFMNIGVVIALAVMARARRLSDVKPVEAAAE
jgi:BASS family bile acid:Na+ symporter